MPRGENQKFPIHRANERGAGSRVALVAVFVLSWLLMACTEGVPEFADLGSTLDAPHGFEQEYTIQSLTTDLELTGSCDPRLEDLQVKASGEIWQQAQGVSALNVDKDCSDGQFHLVVSNVGEFLGFREGQYGSSELYVRGDAGNIKSQVATVTVHYTDGRTPPDESPTILSVQNVYPPMNRIFFHGQILKFRVAFDGSLAEVTGGTPYMKFSVGASSDGTSEIKATFDRVANGNELVFKYLVTDGDMDLNGLSLIDNSGSPFFLNGATLSGVEGQSVDNSYDVSLVDASGVYLFTPTACIEYPNVTAYNSIISTGSVAYPHIICTEEQFADIGNSACGPTVTEACKNDFVLMSHLDLGAGQTINIGHCSSEAGHFNGSFRGFNFNIKDWYASGTNKNNVGLFPCIGSSGKVMDLKMSYVNISCQGGENVGMLAANSYGLIENVHIVSVNQLIGGTNVGGLVGALRGGKILNSHATTSTYGLGNVGGLVGLADSSAVIKGGSSNSVIQGCSGCGSTQYLGGLVGKLDNNSKIYTSYHTNSVGSNALNNSGGTVKTHGAGGLVGYAGTGTHIEDSYARGDVYAEDMLGGLIGVWNGAEVKNSYSSVNLNVVDASYYVGGFIGKDASAAISSSYFRDNFWNSSLFLTNISDVGPSHNIDDITAKTSTDLKSLSTYTNTGWDTENIWLIDGSNLPKLR